MPNAIAFFPWVSIDQAIDAGAVRLLPYRRGQHPGCRPEISQTDMDNVLAAYAEHPHMPIARATILELEDWAAGSEVTDHLGALFRVRNAIAFSALSQRKLFSGSFHYCNYDAYTLVVQALQPGQAGSFAFTTRRRDGGTTHHWSSDEFAFHRPNHVDSRAIVSIDTRLLEATLLIDQTNASGLYEAMVEFCCANTDSPDIPEHVELVMMKSAFEWLMDIDQKADSFTKAIEGVIGDLLPTQQPHGPLEDEWKKRRPHATRILDAWAREFCAVRGMSAHGKQRDADRFVWSARAHLAFSSMLLPLIFKKKLASEGIFEIDSYDVERLRCIEDYLLHDPFSFDWHQDRTHPWTEIENAALISAKAHLFYPESQ